MIGEWASARNACPIGPTVSSPIRVSANWQCVLYSALQCHHRGALMAASFKIFFSLNIYQNYTLALIVMFFLLSSPNSLQCMFYSGQLDIIVGATLTENFLQNLQWEGQAGYLNATKLVWKVNPTDTEVAGYVRQYMYFYQVTNSGPVYSLLKSCIWVQVDRFLTSEVYAGFFKKGCFKTGCRLWCLCQPRGEGGGGGWGALTLSFSFFFLKTQLCQFSHVW